MDLLPTIAEVAGATLDPAITIDGVSIASLLRGEQTVQSPERQLLWHFPYYHGKGRMENPPTVAGINDPIDPMLGPHSSLMQWPFKLIYWYESGETELFNLESDPSEQVNLAESHEVAIGRSCSTDLSSSAG
jgi:arylsulfatase A